MKYSYIVLLLVAKFCYASNQQHPIVPKLPLHELGVQRVSASKVEKLTKEADVIFRAKNHRSSSKQFAILRLGSDNSQATRSWLSEHCRVRRATPTNMQGSSLKSAATGLVTGAPVRSEGRVHFQPNHKPHRKVSKAVGYDGNNSDGVKGVLGWE